MKRRTKAILTVLGLMLLLLVGAGIYGRYIARNHYPFVRIHSPVRYEQLVLGDEAFLHATARSSAGIERVELWVDGVLFFQRLNPGNQPASPMGLAVPWVPSTLGRHELIVRAVTPSGVVGQASVVVEAVEGSPFSEALEEVVQENAGEDQTSRPAGGSYFGSPAGYPDPFGEDAPDLPGQPPGSSNHILSLVGFYFSPIASEEESRGDFVRFEASRLFTEIDYDRVFCYFGIGSMEPRWFPDLDGNPATDEYFDRIGPHEWDIETYLSGEKSLVLAWPLEDPIPVYVHCVGIIGGGAEAIELGEVDLEIGRDDWDGILRMIESQGGEDSFSLEYAISPADDPPGDWYPIDLDPDMSVPFDLRLEGAMLRWEFDLGEDEEPIDGFRVYLDDYLMWQVPADERGTFIPAQLLHPPCGESYRFHLESFRGPDWSLPSNYVSVTSGPEDPECRRVRVTFNTLTTFELGPDDEDAPADIGPVSGSFTANDESAFYTGLCPVSRCTFSDFGLFDNREYPILGEFGLTTYPGWQPTGPADWVIDVPPGEGLDLSFDVIDYDRRGAWYIVCLGSVHLEDGDFSVAQEGTIRSDMGRGECEVSYSVVPVQEGEEDWFLAPPFPRLDIDNITLTPSGDQPVIHFVNTGTGDWAGQDIEIRAMTHEGEFIGFYNWPGQFIYVGEELPLVHPRLRPERPLDLCIEIDPYNRVLERNEAITGEGGLPFTVYCQPEPDLIVQGVARQFGTSEVILTVQNIGEGMVQGEPLGVQLLTADGQIYPEDSPYIFEEFSNLDSFGVTGFRWDVSELVSPEILDQGYTIIVNPAATIAESDESNNEYEVPANPEMAFLALGGQMRWYPLHGYDVCEPGDTSDAEPQDQVITFDVQAWSVFGHRSVGSLTLEYEIEGAGLHTFVGAGEQRIEFELDGTEQLVVVVTGVIDLVNDVDIGTAVWTPLTSEDGEGWGAIELVNSLGGCTASGSYSGGDVYPPEARQSSCGTWQYFYKVCRLAQ